MTDLELLKHVADALCQIRNQSLNGKIKDTYALCNLVEARIKEKETNEHSQNTHQEGDDDWTECDNWSRVLWIVCGEEGEPPPPPAKQKTSHT